jgi:hypothetical protein
VSTFGSVSVKSRIVVKAIVKQCNGNCGTQVRRTSEGSINARACKSISVNEFL